MDLLGRSKRGRPKIRIIDAVKEDMMIGVTEGRPRVKVYRVTL